MKSKEQSLSDLFNTAQDMIRLALDVCCAIYLHTYVQNTILYAVIKSRELLFSNYCFQISVVCSHILLATGIKNMLQNLNDM